MKNFTSAAFLVAAIAGFSCPAAAAPFVSAVSTYDIYMSGETSGQAFSGTATFDGIPSIYTRAGQTLTLTESETDLGGGVHLLSINLSASGELFPSSGEGAIVGLGTSGNGLDFVEQVHLADARIKYYTSNGLFFT